MRRPKLDQPNIKTMVLQGLILGQSQGSLAKALGYYRSQICRFAKRDDVKEIVQSVQIQIVAENLSKVAEWFTDLIQNEQQDPLKELMSFKASQQVLDLAGVLSPSIHGRSNNFSMFCKGWLTFI
jgi:hypothetical protein